MGFAKEEEEVQEASTDSSVHPPASGLVGSSPLSGSSGRYTSTDGSSFHPVQERYGFHSTCLQIKEPIRSIKFYQDVLGMEIVKETESDDYTMYFLGFKLQRKDEHFGSRQGLLQLVHVHGTEADDSFRIKQGHPGFSHFSVSVPDVDRARIRMEKMNVEIVEDGTNARGFAAIADPDGYHIQLIAQSLGEDDALRAELERLMKEPGLTFSSVNSATNTTTIQEVPDELRFAKGGSPVSPRSPNHR